MLPAALPLCASAPSRIPRAYNHKPKVIIIGGGLTGCITAALLKRRRPDIELELWERASYASGRFGAGLACHGRWADLGAQVLSVADVGSGHPNSGADGHNVMACHVHAASDEVSTLEAQGFLVRASDDFLGDTEERMKYQGLWRHYWCTGGFGTLLNHYLEASGARVKFKTRALNVALVGGSQIGVNGIGSDRVSPISSVADAVVLSVPAPEAVDLLDGSSLIPESAMHALRRVEYDSRIAVAFCFDSALRAAFEEVFRSTAELTVDIEDAPGGSICHGSVHLLCYQDSKRPSCYGDPVMLVAHSTPSASLHVFFERYP